MKLIEPGRTAPSFTLKDQDETAHRLADYRGAPLVLFFYPKDLTTACTEQACAFESLRGRFERAGARVLGISRLGTRSKKKFAEAHSLGYPLLADDAEDDNGKPAPKVLPRYGVWIEKSMYGKKYMGIQRTTYLIDSDGKVARRWDKVRVPGHADEVLAAVSELGR